MRYKLLLVVILVSAAAGLLALAYPWTVRTPKASIESSAQAAAPKIAPESAPEFPQDTQWIQSEPLKLSDLRGRVVILHFWTFGCINCIHNYPAYKAWQEKYARKAVTIIGVHTPEFANEADAARVRGKARDNGLQFPIAIDNDSRIWKSWDNHFWPSIYLIDKEGRVRYHWDGELHLESVKGRQFASRIDDLLVEKPRRRGLGEDALRSADPSVARRLANLFRATGRTTREVGPRKYSPAQLISEEVKEPHLRARGNQASSPAS